VKLNNHNTMSHHIYQINMHTLGQIFILVAYEQWKIVHLTNHIAIALTIHINIY